MPNIIVYVESFSNFAIQTNNDMNSNPEMITIRKVVRRNDKTLNIETDNILLSDIKSFRTWHKDSSESESIEGDMTQVSMLFPKNGDHVFNIYVNNKTPKEEKKSTKDYFYNIYINESEDSFRKRLGDNFVIGLSDGYQHK